MEHLLRPADCPTCNFEIWKIIVNNQRPCIGSKIRIFYIMVLDLIVILRSNLKYDDLFCLRILQIQPHYVPFECLSAWIGLELESERKKTSENTSQSQRLDSDCMEASLHVFDEVLGRGNCIDALIGRAYYYELKDEFAKAIDELNQVRKIRKNINTYILFRVLRLNLWITCKEVPLDSRRP